MGGSPAYLRASPILGTQPYEMNHEQPDSSRDFKGKEEPDEEEAK